MEVVIDHREVFTMVQQPSRDGTYRCTCNHENVDEKLNAILSKLVKMELQMGEQASLLALLTKEGGNSLSQMTQSIEKTFPLKTVQEFEELECSLGSDAELFENVVGFAFFILCLLNELVFTLKVSFLKSKNVRHKLFKYKGATVWGSSP
ncbi:uncharacterized protein LOC124159895 [Ischnura elegans]|uniref:uncharacterized protein LOC124159895 n=1 Tax=Ischnura elegans TaxID=197161 RepID=UPI001ED8B3A7|nr:uncharacterized protein LOC124159895 [Ischnura elegans]